MGVFLKVEYSTFELHPSVICGSLCLAHEADAIDPLLVLTGWQDGEQIVHRNHQIQKQ